MVLNYQYGLLKEKYLCRNLKEDLLYVSALGEPIETLSELVLLLQDQIKEL